MKRVVMMLAFWLFASSACHASPLTDFSPGRWAFDFNGKPHTYVGAKAFEVGVSAGLGNDWAVAFRQLGYDTTGPAASYRTRNQEINLVRKISEGLQLFAGYSRTAGSAKNGGSALAEKKVLQAGVIAARKVSDRLTLYTIIGGGCNVTNVEFGLSYLLGSNLELTSTYRHLTVEKVGAAAVKENFRGFGIGLTLKI